MNFIVFDLEATCEKDNKEFQNEIIEIGAVKINDKLETIGEFNNFVRPMRNPKLTNFCKELTTIKQEDVDRAEKFPIVLKKFLSWIGVRDEYYILCSWGFYDKNQFMNDCRYHGEWLGWLDNHISLKHQFAEIKKIKPCGMEKALNILKLPLDGTHHRGIDDAKNISKIFKTYFGQWKF